MKKFIAVFLCLAVCLSQTVFVGAQSLDEPPEAVAAAEKLVAFPGAEGGGMYTTGRFTMSQTPTTAARARSATRSQKRTG